MNEMSAHFSTQNLAVGYKQKILIGGIDLTLSPGKILTLIGPNGAGKSTILKTITRQLKPIRGTVFIGETPIQGISNRDFAKKTAVVLTERVHPELMSCADVVAMGRYPYTDMFGKLTVHDKEVVRKSLEQVHALDLAGRDFSTLSDGQRQRILLARAICQEPEIIVLDEPTAYLDIHYKIELLDILRKMAREQGTTVIMSLHEVDLAMKISDEILCLDGEKITAYGTPETIFSEHAVEKLYNISSGSYNSLFGSIELPKPVGEPLVFVLAGNGKGTALFRALQKKGIPFAAGILFKNDVDCQTADALSERVIKNPAFEPVSEETMAKAKELLLRCSFVLDAGTEIRTLNRANAELLEYARAKGIPVCSDIEEITGHEA